MEAKRFESWKQRKNKRVRFCGCTCLLSEKNKNYKVAYNRVWEKKIG